MNSDLQSRLRPPTPSAGKTFSELAVNNTAAKPALDSTAKDKTDFKDLLLNSNDEMVRNRAAKKNGGLAGAKTDDEFFKMLEDNINRANKRLPSNKLDKDAFLKLFVTQIQYQDPLNPDDSSEMAAQLAQFDGLEQMMNVNKTLEKMTADNQTTRAVGLIDFVGKDVTIEGGKLRLEKNKLTNANFNLEKDANKTILEVRNSTGIVVDEQDMGNLRAGDHSVEWDGKSKDGKTLPDGTYTFAVVAKDLQDQSIPTSITSTVKITGVDLQDKGGSFYTEIGKVRVEEITAVGKSGFKFKGAEAGLDQLNKDLAQQAAAATPTSSVPTGQPSADMIEQALQAAAAQFSANSGSTEISKPAEAKNSVPSNLMNAPDQFSPKPLTTSDSTWQPPAATGPAQSMIEVPVPAAPASSAS